MKQAKKLKVFGLMTMLISMVFMVSSCSDDDTGGGALSYGKVTGVVTDDLSSPLEGVTVQVDGSGITATPDGPRATTNSQGVYTLENISIGTHIITFTKADYQTVSVTVVAGKFNEEQVAEVSPKMEYAAAKIKGKVTDQKGEPLIGASVMYKGTNIGTVTDVNGEFSLLKKAENKQLTAQYIGYDPVEVPVDTSRTMLIAMNEDQKGLSEVVVVGHGVNKKANKDNTPQPVDGKRKYLKYLKKNLVRPTDETCAQVKGKVVLTFLVNRDGRPFHIKVKKSLCESSDKEAIRLVQEGPDWTYGNKQAEVTVKFD